MNSDRTWNDRRRARRFPISREVRYRILDGNASATGGAGRTINMSSAGVCFTTRGDLAPGQRLELAVSWPAPRDAGRRLEFVAQCSVARAGSGVAAAEIMQYEFRARLREPEQPDCPRDIRRPIPV
ncbi:MAG: PilZ domain-containing protein [Acidobacteria bacterium]|nr:PilZ domain-containing protein [Acidobacteriota bacterium]